MALKQNMNDPHHPTKGRAACTNPCGRFDRYETSAISDGWSLSEGNLVRTEVHTETARRIITRNTSPDISFDRSINPYRGCEHGCIYCYARPSHGYLGLSAGVDFETKLTVKPNADVALRKELSNPRYSPAPIAIGTNTDAYQPIEQNWRVMRRVLEVLQAFRHPVTIVTKGTLIERDIDILADMAANGLARVGVSVTTLDADLSRALEPRVPAPKRRLATISRLSDAGIPVRVCASPMIPGLTDHELEAILTAGRDAGAKAATYISLRLPYEVSQLFQEWLHEHRPDRAARVMARVRDSHGGKDYDPDWGKRMTGEGESAALLAHRFAIATKRLGLDVKVPRLRTDLFAKPVESGDQLSLF